MWLHIVSHRGALAEVSSTLLPIAALGVLYRDLHSGEAEILYYRKEFQDSQFEAELELNKMRKCRFKLGLNRKRSTGERMVSTQVRLWVSQECHLYVSQQ